MEKENPHKKLGRIWGIAENLQSMINNDGQMSKTDLKKEVQRIIDICKLSVEV